MYCRSEQVSKSSQDELMYKVMAKFLESEELINDILGIILKV